MENCIEDIMIQATIYSNVDKDLLLETFYNNGISGVFNLGLETMYKYLKDREVSI